tara:strand:+ start:2498 stop:2947 length:450 start_codon:yes stop_codon:yes gene_type:complete
MLGGDKMEPKDIELKLNIKNYKAGKFLHLLALDSIEAFEKSHPNVIPLLLTSLKHGDPKKSLEMAERLEIIVEHLLNNAKVLKENIKIYMYSQLEEEFKKDGSGSKFITTNGNVGFAFEKGKETVEVDFDSSKGENKEESDEIVEPLED